MTKTRNAISPTSTAVAAQRESTDRALQMSRATSNVIDAIAHLDDVDRKSVLLAVSVLLDVDLT